MTHEQKEAYDEMLAYIEARQDDHFQRYGSRSVVLEDMLVKARGALLEPCPDCGEEHEVFQVGGCEAGGGE